MNLTAIQCLQESPFYCAFRPVCVTVKILNLNFFASPTDTAFMYMIGWLLMLKIYQTRHPDINPQAYVAYFAISIVIMLAVIGVVSVWLVWLDTLTPLPLDKMAAISQTTFSNAFSLMKIYWFWLRFHWSLFLMVHLPIFLPWFR